MTRKNDSTRSIAHALTGQVPAYGPGQGKTVKYPAFKKIVIETVSAHAPHTRLPPIRVLAKSLGISLVTAQRVVTELIADGVLYSRPRAGVYVADKATPPPAAAPAQPSTPADFAGNPSFESRFRFGTESRADFQRALWAGLIQRFGERYPNTRAELTFVNDPTDPACAIDVYERLGWNTQWSGDESNLLDLRTFAPDDLAARCTDQGTLPLYFRSNYLFFNPDLLQRCEVPAPAFQTFAGQLAYLTETAPRLQRRGFDPRPFAVQQPVTLVGSSHLPLYFSLVYDDRENPASLAAITAIAQNAIQLCLLSRRAPGLQNPLAREERARFMAGREPFFLGHSVDFWEFGQATLPFAVQCHPCLCTDDSLFLWPMVGGVSRHSRRPAESIRFLSYLVSPESQAQFARTGNFPANLASQDAPSMAVDPAWLERVMTASQPMHLPTAERFYLAINVLNNELWHALLGHVSVEQAMKQAIHLGRSYLRQHTPEHANF